jgi:hypothetical protein
MVSTLTPEISLLFRVFLDRLYLNGVGESDMLGFGRRRGRSHVPEARGTVRGRTQQVIKHTVQSDLHSRLPSRAPAPGGHQSYRPYQAVACAA